MLISIAGIIVFGILKAQHSECYTYEIIANFFISFLGGAILSFSTSLIGFLKQKRQYQTHFASHYMVLLNKIKQLYNCFEWHYKEIKFPTYNETPDALPEKERTEFYMQKIAENEELVSRFYNIIKEITAYNYTEIYDILDDYTSLFKNSPKARAQMMIMYQQINQFHILRRDKKVGLAYALYEQKDYDGNLFYQQVLSDYKKLIDENKMEDLIEEYNLYIKVTNINDYMKKIYKDFSNEGNL